jgi:type VI secretion system protein ImpF
MSPTDTQYRTDFSFLDRLVNPDSNEQTAPGRLSAVDLLQDTVRRDLALLLNTRRKEHPIPREFEQCNRSLLVFGLPDFTAFSLRNPGDQRKLAQAIEAAMRAFEPRLSGVSVSPEARNELDPILRFRVDALLDIQPVPEPIAFDTVLQADTGRFLVTGQKR